MVLAQVQSSSIYSPKQGECSSHTSLSLRSYSIAGTHGSRDSTAVHLEAYWAVVSMVLDTKTAPLCCTRARKASLLDSPQGQLRELRISDCISSGYRAVPFLSTIASRPTSEIFKADSQRTKIFEYIYASTVRGKQSFILQHQSFSLSSTFFTGKHFLSAASTTNVRYQRWKAFQTIHSLKIRNTTRINTTKTNTILVDSNL